MVSVLISAHCIMMPMYHSVPRSKQIRKTQDGAEAVTMPPGVCATLSCLIE